MKTKFKSIQNLLLILILALGLFLRVVGICRVPSELFGDEVDAGIQAYSILKIGKDIFGNPYPVIFHSFSEYRLPLQIYAMTATVGIFGLNEVGVRLASVAFGMLSIVGMFFLTKELLNEKIAIIAALFLSISPWHLQLSRQANDSGFLLPFVIFGLWLFIKGLKKYPFLLASSFLFSLSFYAYATASVFVPVFVLFLLIIYRKIFINYGLKRIALLAVVVLIALTPYLSASIKGTTTKRFNYLSVFNDGRIEQESADKINISNSFVTRIFYSNKSLAVTKILANYLDSYSTNFLLTLGDPDLRNSVGGMGELYYFDVAFIIVGIYILLTKYYTKDKRIMVIFLWFLTAPIPSSLTSDGANHAARLILMLPPLIILSAVGFYYLLTRIKKYYQKVLFVGIILIMFINMAYYFNRYYVIWPKESWRFWQVGYKEMFSFVRGVEAGYDRVYFNNTYEPALPRFLFWYKYSPELFQKQFADDKSITNIVPGFDGFALGNKYYFGQIQKPIENFPDKNSLIVASARDDVTDPSILEKPGINLLKTVNNPYGQAIFYVFTIK